MQREQKFLGKTFRVEALYGREYKCVVQQDFCMGFSDQLYQAFFFFFLAQIVLTRVWFKRFLPWHNVRVVYDRCNGGLLK